MDLNDIKRLSGEIKVPVGIIEKDYVLTLTLSLLSNSEMIEHMVFKGGTAIKKMYFPDARFSVDLDFDFKDIAINRIKKELAELIKLDMFDKVKFAKIKDEFESKKGDVYRCTIEYEGPIKHNLNQSVRLDFSGRASNLCKVEERKILEDYVSETTDVKIRTMDLTEIFAEKCRALITRKEQKSKDLFDIYFLINKGVIADKRLIDKKFTGYKERFDMDYFTRAINDISGVWKRDLQDLLPRGNIPDINNTASLVRKKLF
jgi:predicted nucleotidyltransferase component of viral defense system